MTPLELLFDLIFVFAITQVLWWAWAAYAWPTNTIDPEAGAVRPATFAAMGAMPVASVAVPDVFGEVGHARLAVEARVTSEL